MPKIEQDDLLGEWKAAKKKGRTRKEFAASLGIEESTLNGRLARAKRNRKVSTAHSVDDITDGNYRTISSSSLRIRTVDELIKACKVDLSVWRIEDPVEIGSWEMGRRAEKKDLKWNNGTITRGYSIDSGLLHIEALFRIRVKLVKIRPEAVHPVIASIVISHGRAKKVKPETSRSGLALIVPDSQMGFRRDIQQGNLNPYHDRYAHDILIQVASQHKFDYVTYLGDGLDFSEWTDKFVREPEFAYTTQPALIEFSWFLSKMKQALPGAKHEMLLGNHEDRLEKHIIKHLRAAYRLQPATEMQLDEPFNLSRLLGLRDIGIELTAKYPNGEVWYGDKAKSIHGMKVAGVPGGTAVAVLKDATVTTLFGHIHRIEQATKTIDDRYGVRYVTAASPGCICRIDYTVPGHKKGQHWQQGFGVLHYGMASPMIELVPIKDGCAVYNGKIFNGQNYKKQLIQDTGYKF